MILAHFKVFEDQSRLTLYDNALTMIRNKFATANKTPLIVGNSGQVSVLTKHILCSIVTPLLMSSDDEYLLSILSK